MGESFNQRKSRFIRALNRCSGINGFYSAIKAEKRNLESADLVDKELIENERKTLSLIKNRIQEYVKSWELEVEMAYVNLGKLIAVQSTPASDYSPTVIQAIDEAKENIQRLNHNIALVSALLEMFPKEK